MTRPGVETQHTPGSFNMAPAEVRQDAMESILSEYCDGQRVTEALPRRAALGGHG